LSDLSPRVFARSSIRSLVPQISGYTENLNSRVTLKNNFGTRSRMLRECVGLLSRDRTFCLFSDSSLSPVAAYCGGKCTNWRQISTSITELKPLGVVGDSLSGDGIEVASGESGLSGLLSTTDMGRLPIW
jgi:hypothetical protein